LELKRMSKERQTGDKSDRISIIERNPNLERPFKNLLDEMQVSWSVLVLEGEGLPRRRMVFTLVFL
jgi:hypothetical protein